MPKPFIKISALIFSHSIAFAVAATGTAGAFVAAEFERAQRSPLFRVGMRAERVPVEGPSLDADLRSIDTEYGAPTADFIRLSLLLRERQFAEAAVVCTRIGGLRCDPKALVEMRETVAR
jgi:hypothetical protein